MNMDPYFATVAQHPLAILASFLVAVMTAFVALDFATRMRRQAEGAERRLWHLAGSLVLGSGLWAMHFVGMSAAVYPFAAAYELAQTGLSWLVAVGAAAGLLQAIGRSGRSRLAAWAGSAAAGGAVACIYYVGMRALVVAPATVYHAEWVAGAVATGALGAVAGVRMFVHGHARPGWRRLARQAASATILGGTFAAMHFLSMAATDFADDAVCLSSDGLDVNHLGGPVAFAALVFLLLMSLMTRLESHAAERSSQLSGSLDLAREELRTSALKDATTGLPNRPMFQDRLKQAVRRGDRRGTSSAVLLVDLDDFKSIDHSWTDKDGDDLLRSVAARLCDVVRETDTVARVGDEQFLVLLEGLSDTEPVVRVAEQVAMTLARPHRVGIDTRELSASIGIAVYPQDGDYGTLVASASAAAASARQEGGARFRFFERGMNDESRIRAEWLNHLRNALPNGELELYYQPKFHAVNGRIAGVEALLRWHHPMRGMVSPAVFIPLAEKFGLMDELGSWVVEQAARQMRRWLEEGIELRVAVNVSVYQLRNPTLARDIGDSLRRHQVAPAMLTCEITESAAMENTAATLTIFEQLQGQGIQISIDDFGTGYSSLAYLRKMPVRQLKIDRSFVLDLCENDDARLVVAGIIDLAHALRLEVVAEGVETECQRGALLEMGCDKLQGFLFARPMPAAALTQEIELHHAYLRIRAARGALVA